MERITGAPLEQRKVDFNQLRAATSVEQALEIASKNLKE